MNETQSVWKRSLTEKNISKIKEELSQVDWTSKLDKSQTCNEQFIILHDIIQNAMNTHAPD